MTTKVNRMAFNPATFKPVRTVSIMQSADGKTLVGTVPEMPIEEIIFLLTQATYEAAKGLTQARKVGAIVDPATVDPMETALIDQLNKDKGRGDAS